MINILARFAAIVLMALSLGACSILSQREYNAVSIAETPEQRTYAVYGSFVVAERQAAAIIQTPGVQDKIKVALQKADAVAKPLADKSLEAADAITDIRRALAMGQTTEDKLNIALLDLEQWYTRLVPAVNDLIKFVEENK